MKLIKKIKIEGTITAETGLHIGGNKSSLEIGGVDLNVIKTGGGIPYIPGSSLKGKMRSLLAKVRGSEKAEKDPEEMKLLFGDSGAADANNKLQTSKGATRLFVRDAHLNTKAFKQEFGEENERELDYAYSEIKTENTIDRSRGTAQWPRQIERVPANTIFDFEMALDIYDTDADREKVFISLLVQAFQLLNLDYLGGHGSRGSGKVTLKVTKLSGKRISEEKGVEALTEQELNNMLNLEELNLG